MEHSNDGKNQPDKPINDAKSIPDSDAAIYPDDERQELLTAITQHMDEDTFDRFAHFLIELATEIQQEPSGVQHVKNELGLLLELVFYRSRAYRLAFELFSSHFVISPREVRVSGTNLEDILIDIKTLKLDTEPPCTIPELRPDTGMRRKAQAGHSDWINRFCEMMAEAIDSEYLPEEVRRDLADMVNYITSEYVGNCSDHARYLLPVALRYFAQGEPSLMETINTKQAEPKEWAQHLGVVVAKIFREDEFTEASRSSISNALNDFDEEIARDAQGFAHRRLPYLLSETFAGNEQPILTVFLTSESGNRIRSCFGSMHEGNVWTNLERLVRDIDQIAGLQEEETATYTLTFYLQREGDASLPIYSRNVSRAVLNPLFEYANTYLATPEEQLGRLIDLLTAFATDPKTPEGDTSKLTTIIARLYDGDNSQETGRLIAQVTKDEDISLPMRKITRDAVEQLMRNLNGHNETIPPWLTLYFAEAE